MRTNLSETGDSKNNHVDIGCMTGIEVKVSQIWLVLYLVNKLILVS